MPEGVLRPIAPGERALVARLLSLEPDLRALTIQQFDGAMLEDLVPKESFRIHTEHPLPREIGSIDARAMDVDGSELGITLSIGRRGEAALTAYRLDGEPLEVPVSSDRIMTPPPNPESLKLPLIDVDLWDLARLTGVAAAGYLALAVLDALAVLLR